MSGIKMFCNRLQAFVSHMRKTNKAKFCFVFFLHQEKKNPNFFPHPQQRKKRLFKKCPFLPTFCVCMTENGRKKKLLLHFHLFRTAGWRKVMAEALNARFTVMNARMERCLCRWVISTCVFWSCSHIYHICKIITTNQPMTWYSSKVWSQYIVA